METGTSDIREFYKGQCIFITGATGFLGKVLVEKLLRSCDIEKLFLLMRTKRGESVKDRLQEYRQNQIFSNIDAKMWLRVHAVEGDVMQTNLGLDDVTRVEVTRSTSIVFHVAASVKFDEPLRSAVLLNTRGTRDVINMAKEMPYLKCLVHVSTAYSNPLQQQVEEKVYPNSADPHKIIAMAESLGDSEAANITERVLGNIPNTYIFTKSLAESLVQDVSDELPVAIFRPSIVTPALREPFPGWADTQVGPMGLLVGAGAGLLRSAYGNGDFVSDLLPVDLAINAMLTVAWATAVDYESCNKANDQVTPVYNCTTSSEAPITWNKFLEKGRSVYAKYPLEQALWFPDGQIYTSKTRHLMAFLLYQLLPALLIDTVMLMSGKKTWLVRLQRRIYSGTQTFQYFLLNEWKFCNHRLRSLLDRMSPVDKQEFDFDASKIDYENYINVWTLGVRRHMMKQKDETIPAARVKYNRLYWMHVALNITIYGVATWAVTSLILNVALSLSLQHVWVQCIPMLP